jgi:hypothetical protein
LKDRCGTAGAGLKQRHLMDEDILPTLPATEHGNRQDCRTTTAIRSGSTGGTIR